MVHSGEIVIMKRLFKKYTFVVYSDGTYQQISASGAVSDFAPDFADTFLTLSANGFKVVRG